VRPAVSLALDEILHHRQRGRVCPGGVYFEGAATAGTRLNPARWVS
jgi:hypothetical protein